MLWLAWLVVFSSACVGATAQCLIWVGEVEGVSNCTLSYPHCNSVGAAVAMLENQQKCRVVILGGIYQGSHNSNLRLLLNNQEIVFEAQFNQSVVFDGGNRDSFFSIVFVSGVNSISFSDITFVNGRNLYSGGAINTTVAPNALKTPSQIIFSKCNFIFNEAESDGGALAFVGPVVPTINNCTFINNTASYYGGAVSLWFYNTNSSNFTSFPNVILSGSFFMNNSGQLGGGLSIILNSPKMELNITYNSSIPLISEQAHPKEMSVLQNCASFQYLVFIGNNAMAGGGIYYEGNSVCTKIITSYIQSNIAMAGGGIFSVSSNSSTSLLLDDTIFSGNRAHRGSTIVCQQEGKGNLTISGSNTRIAKTFENCFSNEFSNVGNCYGMISLCPARLQERFSNCSNCEGGNCFLSASDVHCLIKAQVCYDCNQTFLSGIFVVLLILTVTTIVIIVGIAFTLVLRRYQPRSYLKVA